MTEIIIITAVAILLVFALYKTIRKAKKGGGCCGERESDYKKVRKANAQRRRYAHEATVVISGMTCVNCARRLESALNALYETRASVSLSENRAKLYTMQPLDEALIRKTVSLAGYTVTEINQIK